MDAATFRQLIVPLYSELFAVAVVIVGRRDASADIVQDTMVKLWSNRDKLDNVQSYRGFAITVLRRTAIDYLRSDRHELSVEQYAVDIGQQAPPERAGDIEAIELCIEALPPGQQQVIKMNVFDGLEIEEISQSTGLTPGNVRQLLSRGRRKIRELYKQYTT